LFLRQENLIYGPCTQNILHKFKNIKKKTKTKKRNAHKIIITIFNKISLGWAKNKQNRLRWLLIINYNFPDPLLPKINLNEIIQTKVLCNRWGGIQPPAGN